MFENMSSCIPLKLSCRQSTRLLCACLLLIFLSMMVNLFPRRNSVDLEDLKTLLSKNAKKDSAVSLTPKPTQQTSQKVTLQLNSSKNRAQPYLKILPKNITKPSGESSIPRILHQTWKSPELAVVFKPWIKSCIDQNPDWEYWFWTDQEMRDMVEEKYPEFLKMYDSYEHGIFRADAFRIFVVHQYGGVYADLDFECLQPFEIAIGQQSCFFSIEPEGHAELTKVEGPLVSNALFGCVPNHPFFIFCIQNLKHHSKKHVLDATGPFLLANLHKQFSSDKDQLTSESIYDVPLSESEIFQPTVDEFRLDGMKNRCRTQKSANATERGKRACEILLHKDFRNQPTRRSVTNHHWSHTWTRPGEDYWGIKKKNTQNFNITELNDIRNV